MSERSIFNNQKFDNASTKKWYMSVPARLSIPSKFKDKKPYFIFSYSVMLYIFHSS